MSLYIELSERGSREAAENLRGIGRRAMNARPVWDKLARWIMSYDAGRFRAQPWKPLDADTVRQKGNKRILRLTGTLERALTIWHAPGQTLDIEDDAMRFGLDPRGVAYYGAFHQLGKGVPVRKVLDLPPRAASRRAGELLLDHLMGRL